MAIIILLKQTIRKILVWLGYFPIRLREQEFVLQNIKIGAKYILDVGCSESILPIKLARLGYQVIGLDIRHYPLKHPNLTFIQRSITEPEVFNRKFDTIICLSTLEHIGLGFYGDPSIEAGDRLTLRRLAHLLKDDGRLILTVPFAGCYQMNKFQRIYDYPALAALFSEYWHIEKEAFWIPLSKRNWVPAVNREEAEMVHPGFPESNNACFVLSKIK